MICAHGWIDFVVSGSTDFYSSSCTMLHFPSYLRTSGHARDVSPGKTPCPAVLSLLGKFSRDAVHCHFLLGGKLNLIG